MAQRMPGSIAQQPRRRAVEAVQVTAGTSGASCGDQSKLWIEHLLR